MDGLLDETRYEFHRSQSRLVDWYYPKVHCWVNGTVVVTNSRSTVWFENAQVLKTGEKCYFPWDVTKGQHMTEQPLVPIGELGLHTVGYSLMLCRYSGNSVGEMC